MDAPETSIWGKWLKLPRRLGRRLRTLPPVVSGALAALLVLVVYTTFKPEPDRVTMEHVEESMAEVMASAAPPKAASAEV